MGWRWRGWRGQIALVLCDNLSIHTPRGSRLLRALLAEANAEEERLVLVYTPAYSPDFNADERGPSFYRDSRN